MTTLSSTAGKMELGTEVEEESQIPQALLDEFRSYLPEQIAALPTAEQDAYLASAVRHLQELQRREAVVQDERDRFNESLRQYTPMHADVYTFSQEFLHPALIDLLKTPSAAADGHESLYMVAPHAYSVPCFNPDFCVSMLEELAHFESWCQEHDIAIPRPNSMNRYGLILDLIGFGPFLEQLMERVVSPLASVLYKHYGGDSLTTHHGFVVEYGPQKDKKLDFHVDDSEVTLNICLGSVFTGGELFLRGVRCPLHQHQAQISEEEAVSYTHRVGSMLIHPGCHRHGALPLTSGSRTNLILWCRSTKYRNDVDYRVCPGSPSCDYDQHHSHTISDDHRSSQHTSQCTDHPQQNQNHATSPADHATDVPITISPALAHTQSPHTTASPPPSTSHPAIAMGAPMRPTGLPPEH